VCIKYDRCSNYTLPILNVLSLLLPREIAAVRYKDRGKEKYMRERRAYKAFGY